MPVSANEEAAVKSLSGQSSLNIAGVPVKKRWFACPASPTQQKQQQQKELLLHYVENDSAERQRRGNASQELELAADSSCLSDANKISAPEFDARTGSDKMVLSSQSQESNTLAKPVNKEKLWMDDKSTNLMTVIKTLGGVPMKKRRFIRPLSPPPETHPPLLVEKDSVKKENCSPYKESILSDSSVAGSSSVLSDGNKTFPPEDIKKSGDYAGQVDEACDLKVKIEEACGTFHSKAEVEKLVVAKKSANVWVKSLETELNLAPSRFPVLNTCQGMSNQQVDGKCSKTSSVSTVELPLGSKECQLSALEGQSNDGSSRNQGSAEPVSLKLWLSNAERSTQSRIEDLQSNADNSKICADRLHWDLNTTMDAWEASVSEEAGLQVPADGSKEVGVTHDVNPLTSTEMVGDSSATGRHLLNENESITSSNGAPSKSVQQYDSEDRLHLRLSPSFLSFNSHASSSSSANIDSVFSLPNISSPLGFLSGANMVDSKTVNFEPFDEIRTPDSLGAKVNPMLSLDFRAVSVKCELIDKVAEEDSKSPSYSAGKLADGKTVKSEPVGEDNPENIRVMAATSHQYNKPVLKGQDTRGQSTHSSMEHVMQGQHDKVRVLSNLTDQQVLEDHNTSKEPASSIGSSLNGNLPDHLGNEGASETHLVNEFKESCESAEQVAAEMSSPAVRESSDENEGTGAADAAIPERRSAENVEQYKLNVLHSGAHRDGEVTVSDEEKINLSSVLEEDSYRSEYESDGDSVPMDLEEDGWEQDDYEDGEVHEPQQNEVDGSVSEKGDIVRQADYEDKTESSVGLHADVQPSSSHAGVKEINMEEPVETIKSTAKEIYSVLERKTIEDADKDALKEESSAFDVTASEAEEKKVVDTIQGKPLDGATEKGLGLEQLSNQATCGGQGTSESAAQGADQNVKRNNEQKNESAPSKAEETSLNGVAAPKDANSGRNQSRIINLSMASKTSFGKLRSISDKPPLSLRPIRERLDVPLEGDGPHFRGRDELYDDGSQKFTRERYQELRNSRWNFVHGRGRLASRIDSAHNGRGSERDCVPRHKYAYATVASDDEFMDYNMGLDDSFVGTVRSGRKLVDDDDTSFFRHISSRRHLPGGRDGSASCGGLHIGRVPRSIDEDNCEAFGLRHTEKTMRGFPEDGGEHTYAHPQQPYEELVDRFVRGPRNFSSVNRRGLPQMHSKSPVRSRSPGPWSSRRRSPDGIGGPLELPHQRSIYRMERIRSSDNPGFPAERMGGRRVSPSYMSQSNAFREVNTGRDHCHPRCIISRSPTRLGGFLGSRRFGIVDPQERPEDENFFAGYVHSSQFHELGRDGNEESRRFGDRGVPVRSFRAPFNNSDGKSFNFNMEDGRRSFRFYPEVDPNFHERPSLREREYGLRIKNRPGNAPRRPRSIDDEQEGNCRNGGHVLYDDSFDDISRAKRKRF